MVPGGVYHPQGVSYCCLVPLKHPSSHHFRINSCISTASQMRISSSEGSLFKAGFDGNGDPDEDLSSIDLRDGKGLAKINVQSMLDVPFELASLQNVDFAV